jgi:NAD(P)-dependent dehydrogenase (short-subunit alcohol dehydrogenase family)
MPWALILGASSGMGLATAKKLAADGFHIIAVHRDRKGSMPRVQKEFDTIAQYGRNIVAINENALTEDGRQSILAQISDYLGGGQIKLMLHSIALGNLKLAAPLPPPKAQESRQQSLQALAKELGIPAEDLTDKLRHLVQNGHAEWDGFLAPDDTFRDDLLTEEDFQQTIHNMGYNLLLWTQDLLRRGMFAGDARVIGLTSEGNQKAWRGYAAVAAAKCTLESISRTIAKEFAPHGIRCNIIQAGITETPALRLIPGYQKMIQQARTRNPLGRLTTPYDVANAIALLARPEAAWINGALLHVDGGEHLSDG